VSRKLVLEVNITHLHIKKSYSSVKEENIARSSPYAFLLIRIKRTIRGRNSSAHSLSVSNKKQFCWAELG
jgi:hypothetical protein